MEKKQQTANGKKSQAANESNNKIAEIPFANIVGACVFAGFRNMRSAQTHNTHTPFERMQFITFITRTKKHNLLPTQTSI